MVIGLQAGMTWVVEAGGGQCKHVIIKNENLFWVSLRFYLHAYVITKGI